MTVYGLLTFCAVYVLAVATPGPGIAAIIARVLSRGTTGDMGLYRRLRARGDRRSHRGNAVGCRPGRCRDRAGGDRRVKSGVNARHVETIARFERA